MSAMILAPGARRLSEVCVPVSSCARTPASPSHGVVGRPDGDARESTYFLSVNKNKRSITVDIKHEEGRRIVLDLARTSDVLVENYLPGKLASMGLGYEDVKAVNPRLVYCSLTGFGQTGPRASHAAYDVPIAAMGGLLSITGHPDGPSTKVCRCPKAQPHEHSRWWLFRQPGVALVDVLTGLQAHGAILAALLRRATTNRGQHIDCCLLDTQVGALA